MAKKVLFLIESLAGGGAEKVLTTLVQNIDKNRFDVTVCAISGGGKYEDAVRQCVSYQAILDDPISGNTVRKFLYKVKHHLVYRWMPLSWVYRLFAPQGNDVEVAFVEGFTTKLLSHSTNRKAKMYAWVHIDLHQNHWTRRVYRDLEEESEAYARYAHIIGVSDTVVAAFHQEFSKVDVPTATIYNPIHSVTILRDSQEPVALKRPESILMVTVGRLEPQKAYMRLLKIMKRLTDERVDVKLWVLGDGTERGLLENYIEEHHLQENVSLLGFQANPYKYLHMGDLFVCSSRAEGYSTAVTEALILGLPVITTDCSGMAELLKDGECGMITENDDEALYVGMKQLLSDEAMLNHYRQKAVERGKEFAIDRLMKPIENLLMV